MRRQRTLSRALYHNEMRIIFNYPRGFANEADRQEYGQVVEECKIYVATLEANNESLRSQLTASPGHWADRLLTALERITEK